MAKKSGRQRGGLGRGLAALMVPDETTHRVNPREQEHRPQGPTSTSPHEEPVSSSAGQDGARTEDAHADAKTAPSVAEKLSHSRGLGGAAADVIIGGGKLNPRDRRDVPVRVPAPAEGAEVGAHYQEIPIGQIVPNPQQPRTVFEEDALAELVHSIREFGLLQPIVVRPHPEGEGYELIMGERRWRASAKAGLSMIPAIVRESEDSTLLRDALLENIHRVELNPLEEAAAYQQLLEEFQVTQAELAEKLGRSRPVVTNMIRLLSLPVAVQRKVAAGVLSAGHARALLGIKAEPVVDLQDELAERIIAEGLSVRATEEAVTLMNRGDKVAQRKPREKTPPPEYLQHAAERLADDLDTRVIVSMGKRKGKLTVEFSDQEDFERIMGLLGQSQ
ncbi:ParB/RepB/Spo0J family partition protein [Corynebacterium poyangense]|uniref:ParB/RepB/Spo0J family partition protein n=1 Tax=Corynebacterium poyangense TaxID=2684405 RepID=A0A7H0SS02_9CORY|nr:ParB/RepB/Spo0J family partition protein [Corynebacterium poyangense]MBZ8177273.1 ParB/RepB/Spo0J family partition protein [Corynebacterium poyangense]QNQ91327.1 ParB/RepB/Spo0J family partition protein [Corynebacterium poyangense]